MMCSKVLKKQDRITEKMVDGLKLLLGKVVIIKLILLCITNIHIIPFKGSFHFLFDRLPLEVESNVQLLCLLPQLLCIASYSHVI